MRTVYRPPESRVGRCSRGGCAERSGQPARGPGAAGQPRCNQLRVEDGSGTGTIGRLTRLTADEITLQTAAGEKHFTRDTVRQVAVRRQPLRMAVLIGAGVGAATGAVAGCAARTAKNAQTRRSSAAPLARASDWRWGRSSTRRRSSSPRRSSGHSSCRPSRAAPSGFGSADDGNGRLELANRESMPRPPEKPSPEAERKKAHDQHSTNDRSVGPRCRL